MNEYKQTSKMFSNVMSCIVAAFGKTAKATSMNRVYVERPRAYMRCVAWTCCRVADRRFNPAWVNKEQPIPVPPPEFDQGFGVVIAHYNTSSREFCVLKCQERNFPVCVGVDFREGYGCDLLSLRLRYTSNYNFVSIVQPMFRNLGER